jgi:hypothetical protein
MNIIMVNIMNNNYHDDINDAPGSIEIGFRTPRILLYRCACPELVLGNQRVPNGSEKFLFRTTHGAFLLLSLLLLLGFTTFEKAGQLRDQPWGHGWQSPRWRCHYVV